MPIHAPIARRILRSFPLALLSAVPAQDPPPTFAGDVATLLYSHCLPCHREGREAPFALRTHRDVAKRGRLILDLVERRIMPPWLPAPEPAFVGERRLEEREIALLRRWVEAGMPEGDPAHTPSPPAFPSGWSGGEPDLVLEPEAGFPLPAAGPEVFRNFVLPIPGDRVLMVRRLELDPGSAAALHHALIQVDPTPTARRLAAADPLPGFAGMEMGKATPPDGHMIGWTPGKGARTTPDDMAFRLHPGTDLVLQVHLRPTGREETVRPRVGLWLTERAPTRFPLTLELHDERIDLAAGARDARVADRLTLPAACRVLAVYPHAHYLATRLSARAVLPDGTVRTLLDVPRWDFDWQDEYTYRDPVDLPAGTRIEFDYRYDNSSANPANPNDPPVRVRFGSRSVDEMATLTLQVLPLDAMGRTALERARYEHRLAKDPFDVDALNHLGILAARDGLHAEAAQTFRRALRFAPRDPDLHANLGRTLLEDGDREGARAALARALALEPAHAEALVTRAAHLELEGRPEAARADLERAVVIQPANARAWGALGLLRARQAETGAARAAFLRVLALDPAQPESWCNLATTHLAEGNLEAACRGYRAALAARPDYPNARWLLARTLVELGRREEALAELDVLLRDHPEHEAANSLRQRLR